MITNQKALDFEPPHLLIANFCKDFDISETEAIERFEETKKFLILCASKKNSNYAPSKLVDEMWHQFIVYSKSYFQFCLILGAYIHHEPADKPNVKAYLKTLKDMELSYGSLKEQYWRDEFDAGHCGHCSSCGSSSS